METADKSVSLDLSAARADHSDACKVMSCPNDHNRFVSPESANPNPAIFGIPIDKRLPAVII